MSETYPIFEDLDELRKAGEATLRDAGGSTPTTDLVSGIERAIPTSEAYIYAKVVLNTKASTDGMIADGRPALARAYFDHGTASGYWLTAGDTVTLP